MNNDTEWIPIFTPGEEITWIKNKKIIQDTKNSINTSLKKKEYKNSFCKKNGLYQIGIRKEIADNGNMVLMISLKKEIENEKNKTYIFKVGLDKSWKILEHNYETSDDSGVKSVKGLKIKYIQKTDNNNGGPRFANANGDSIKGFGYFRYLSLDFSHDELMNEIRYSLIYLEG